MIARASAPAKVNLYLHVCGKRADGYHLLDSLIAFCPAAADQISIEAADDFSLRLEGDCAAALQTTQQDDNLVTRAAKALAQATHKPLNCHITLTKTLPVAAGIGGGSSDAAATLKALLDFWGLDRPPAGFDDLLLALGADTPICAQGRAAQIGGIGEVIKPLPAPLPPLFIVLVNPGIACSTPAIFKALTAEDHSGAVTLSPAALASSAALLDFLAAQRNDLSMAAATQVPEIAQILEALTQQEGCALQRLSGSGATCFGLFTSQSLAQRAAEALQAMQPHWWIAHGTLI